MKGLNKKLANLDYVPSRLILSSYLFFNDYIKKIKPKIRKL